MFVRQLGFLALVFGACISGACSGETPADPGREGNEGEGPTVEPDDLPEPGAPPPRRAEPDLEGVEPLSPQFCAAYEALRDAERMLSFGEGDVSLENVDSVVASLRTLSPDAPRMLSAALDASARIYEEERTRIARDQIAEVLMERRMFDDERDLFLQLNVRQDYLARACPEMDATVEPEPEDAESEPAPNTP